MQTSKEKAARQAATLHSTDRKLAVCEYCKIIGLEYLPALHKEIESEMLDLLPPYRHPTFDKFGEYQVFFGPDGFLSTGKMYSPPQFMKPLQEKISISLFNEIAEYVREAELNKIELFEHKNKAHEITTLLANAHQRYKKSGSRADKKNAMVVKLLGFSTGTPRKRIDHGQAYKDYVYLLRRNGLPRKDAVAQIQKKYGFQSKDSTLKSLHESRKGVLTQWKETEPTMLSRIKEHLDGLVPSRR